MVNLGSWITWYISETETNKVFTFQDIKAKIYSYTKKSHLALGNSAKLVFWSILSLKSKHLVCLSFWDISRDSRAKIYHSMDKMWALLYWIDKNDLSICILQNKRIRTQYAEIIFIGNILILCTIVSKIYFRNIYATRIFFLWKCRRNPLFNHIVKRK